MPNYFCCQKTNACQLPGTYLIGIPFDGTACFRRGSALGPAAIREVSASLEDYSPYLDKSLNQIQNFYDLGDLPLSPHPQGDHMPAMAQKFEQQLGGPRLSPQTRLITLGGEHSISYHPLKHYLDTYPNLALIHLDAHADLRDGYQGFHYSHASIIYRIMELFGPDHQLLQYGIRSGTAAEYRLMRERKTLSPSQPEFLAKVAALDPDRPVYLTLDLDYFDPGILPGTGTPEPGGEDFASFLSLNNILNQKNFVGADIVELSPPQDPSGVSSITAAKVVREIALAMN